MKIYNQWKFKHDWGIALFSIFKVANIIGFCIFGFVFEWEIK